MLSKTEIQELNINMLGQGIPNKIDFQGYNKPDYVRMESIGRLDVELNDVETYLVIKTLTRYKNRQLLDYKEDIEDTYDFYREIYYSRYPDVKDRKSATDDAISGRTHDIDDYSKIEFLL